MNTPDYSFRLVSRRRRGCGGFSLIELLTVVAVIAILAALLLPVVGRVRDNAKSARCVSNLRQDGIAIQTYVSDNKGFLPPVGHTNISPYFNADPRNFQVALTPYISVSKSTSWNAATLEGKSYSPTFDCLGFKGEPGGSCFRVQTTVTLPDGSSITPWAGMFQVGSQFLVTRQAMAHAAVPPDAVALTDRDLDEANTNHRGYRNALHFDWHVGRIKLPN